MMSDFDRARAWLHEFKSNTYLFGAGVLPRVGEVVAARGKRATLVLSLIHISEPTRPY